MLGRDAKDKIEEERAEGERAVSNEVSPLYSVPLRSEDELGSGVPLADLV